MDTEVVRTWTREAPWHLIFKVGSFFRLVKSLQQSNTVEFESPHFTSGDSTWVLCIYPEGNKEEGAEEHVSMYLKLVHGPTPLRVRFVFFVYDQLQARYLVVQDSQQRIYDASRVKWGIPQTIQAKRFKNPSNGFLTGDTCIFGVEVFATSDDPHKLVLSKIKRATDRHYTWNIEGLSGSASLFESPTFIIEGYTWKLVMHQQGSVNDGEVTHLSVRIELVDEENLSISTSERAIFATMSCTLLAHSTGEKHTQTRVAWFGATELRNGFEEFVKVDDNVTIELTMNEIFTCKDLFHH